MCVLAIYHALSRAHFASANIVRLRFDPQDPAKEAATPFEAVDANTFNERLDKQEADMAKLGTPDAPVEFNDPALWNFDGN